MAKRWSEDETEFLKVCRLQGWNYEEIANELDRTPYSILKKAIRSNIKHDVKWKIDEDNLIKVCVKDKWTYKEIAKELNRTENATKLRASYLNIKNPQKKLTNAIVDERIKDKHIIRIGDYIDSHTNIKFKCTNCNNILMVKPSNMYNQIIGCPYCATGSFKSYLQGTTYLIYFKELDLYKIGITNNLKERLSNFGYKPEIIFIREFELGKDAKDLETKWLKNIKDYKINTGLLKSGNTETFKYGN